jgi:hypothetical protein
MGLRYDLVGSMLDGVEFCNRSFGAVQTPYSEIRSCRSITAKVADDLRGLARLARQRLRRS